MPFVVVKCNIKSSAEPRQGTGSWFKLLNKASHLYPSSDNSLLDLISFCQFASVAACPRLLVLQSASSPRQLKWRHNNHVYTGPCPPLHRGSSGDIIGESRNLSLLPSNLFIGVPMSHLDIFFLYLGACLA